MLSCSADGTLKLWEVESGEMLKTFEGHEGIVACCCMSGQQIVSGGQDGTLKLWDAKTGENRCTIQAASVGEDYIHDITVLPDTRQVVSASFRGTINVWNVADLQLYSTIDGFGSPTFGAPIACHGDSVLGCCRDSNGTMKIRNARTGRTMLSLEGHSQPVTRCCFAPNGQTILSCSADNTLMLWSASTGRILRVIDGTGFPCCTCGFSPDGKSFFGTYADGTIILWGPKGSAMVVRRE
jgi:WD40 repeat protein